MMVFWVTSEVKNEFHQLWSHFIQHIKKIMILASKLWKWETKNHRSHSPFPKVMPPLMPVSQRFSIAILEPLYKSQSQI